MVCNWYYEKPNEKRTFMVTPNVICLYNHDMVSTEMMLLWRSSYNHLVCLFVFWILWFFQICVSTCESVCDTAHLLWFEILQANRLNPLFWNDHIIQFFVVWTYDTYIISMHSTYMSCIINFTFTFFWYHIASTFFSTWSI